ncbi:MAG TPA: chemotaxis response regulator protein-glutamate methylesterase [Bacillota bacterium]|nr:chemotaxis response regulator protein-glutamate methylesterase [Bacillota bacterium]
MLKQAFRLNYRWEGIRMAIRVLIVDDSAFMRQVILKMLQEYPGIAVVATAKDGLDALAKIEVYQPDVITLDVDMPNMNGLECLAQIMERFPRPVIMVSSLTIEGAEPTMKAMELGAVDFVTKPSITDPQLLENIKDDLIQKVKVASTVKTSQLKKVTAPSFGLAVMKQNEEVIANPHQLELLAIGSSTGGPRALYYLLPQFPKNFPLGIIIAQHMPKDFTSVFAKRLNSLCRLEVVEAKDGDRLEPGLVLVAPAGSQTRVVRGADGLRVAVTEEPKLLYKPSVDYLYKSVAETCKEKSLSVILTGMGSDGAVGMKQLRNLGARTIAEAEESCVVFGMPRVAIEIGAAEYVESLPQIFERIMQIVTT